MGPNAPLRSNPTLDFSPIALVGPCGSGKTTIAKLLQGLGVGVAEIAQEHSCVPTLWRYLGAPRALIYLEASFEACTERKRFRWSRGDYEEQCRRLSHARQNSDLIIVTDGMTPREVVQKVLDYLHGRDPPRMRTG